METQHEVANELFAKGYTGHTLLICWDAINLSYKVLHVHLSYKVSHAIH